MIRFFLVSVFFYGGQAIAQADRSSFQPPPGDASVGFLRDAFGGVVDLIASGSSQTAQADSVVAAGMSIFNSAVLFMAALFVVYTTIKGTIDSAHDGELLGRKMSDVWVPIRTLVGTASLLPLSSGFSLVQVGVLWVAIQGTGIADTLWTSMMRQLSQDNMIGRPAIPDSRPLAANILRFEVCRAAMNKQFIGSGRPDRIEVIETQKTLTNTGDLARSGNAATVFASPALGALNLASSLADATYKVTEYSWSGGNYENSQGVCGSLSWTESEESSSSNGNPNIDKQPILDAHSAATKALIEKMRVVANEIVAGGPTTPGALENAATAYENAVRAGAKTAVEQSNDRAKTEFIELADQGGWIFAGAYYNQIVRLNDAMQSAVNALPTSAPTRIEEMEVKETLHTYQDALSSAGEYIKNRSNAPHASYDQEWQSATERIPTSWEDLKRLASLPALGAINQMTQELAGSNLSHISQMKAVGDTITAAAWATLGTMALANGVANSNAAQLTVGNVFDAGAAISMFGNTTSTLCMLLLFSGLMLAFYVPMIPYINWIVASIKWLVMVVENVIAAPIWAAAHIHPDGDDIVGKAGPGYFIILSTLLRPALMIFGLIFSIILAQPITHLVNSTFMTAVAGSMHGSFNGLGAFVAYTFIYALIMTLVVHAIFGLVNYIPDNVTRWLGHAVGAHGVGDNEGHEVNRVFAGVARQGSHAVPSGLSPRPPSSGGGEISKGSRMKDLLG